VRLLLTSATTVLYRVNCVRVNVVRLCSVWSRIRCNFFNKKSVGIRCRLLRYVSSKDVNEANRLEAKAKLES